MNPPLNKLIVGIALAAAMVAPAAFAQAPAAVMVPSDLMYIQGPGGNTDLSRFENFRGGPGGGGPLLPSDYLGHELGGPGSAGDVSVAFPPVAANGGSGFDWADAAVGAGFMAGIALLLAAGLLAMRGRRTFAH